MDLLIDTNVVLDYFIDRPERTEATDRLFEYIYSGRFTAAIAAHTVPTIWYVLRKEKSPERRRELLKSIVICFTIAPVGEAEILSAIDRDDFSDFEDCVQDECASAIHARYIITRNKADFAKSKIPALLPEEFITLAG